MVIGKDIPEAGKKAVIVESEFEKIISTPPPKAGEEGNAQGTRSLFEKPEEQEVAKATFQVIRKYERLRGSDQLQGTLGMSRLLTEKENQEWESGNALQNAENA